MEKIFLKLEKSGGGGIISKEDHIKKKVHKFKAVLIRNRGCNHKQHRK